MLVVLSGPGIELSQTSGSAQVEGCYPVCTEAWITGSISSREPGKQYKSAGSYNQLQNGTENIKGKRN